MTELVESYSQGLRARCTTTSRDFNFVNALQLKLDMFIKEMEIFYDRAVEAYKNKVSIFPHLLHKSH